MCVNLQMSNIILSHVIIELDLLLFAELEMALMIVNLFFLSQQEGL